MANMTTSKTASLDLSVALISVSNPRKPYAHNKDLNGGFGTADDFKGSFSANAIRFLKKQAVRIPVLTFAHLQAILKQRGCKVKYFEGTLPDPHKNAFDLVLLNGSIVDYTYENELCRNLKKQFPSSTIGFFGDFPSTRPDLFSSGDFVIAGEAEAFFMYEFKCLEQLKGKVTCTSVTDYEQLPTMDLEGFSVDRYCYSLFFRKHFITYQGSKGCPYSCSYYCTYGKIQGSKIRQRSAAKIVGDFKILKEKYGIEIVQFRDPVFGLNKGFIEEFCREIKKQDVRMLWGMETRLDLLTEEKIDMMFEAGLRLINAGVETSSANVAVKNKRLLIQHDHQERLINYCRKKGVKVSAFYVLGFDSDTKESIDQTIRYAISLNTPLARFSVSTPYPGTKFYDQLKAEGRILSEDFEKYTQFNMVFQHDALSPAEVEKLLISAYVRYYLRFGYFSTLLHYLWKKSF